MDVTPQSIRAVQFREKLRGYHPEDVDGFVAAVAQKVEELEGRVKQADARLAELQTRQEGASEAEESLRRTLILAQRTADAAIQEAREEAARVSAEAAEQRARAEAEVNELRQRLHAEAEQEGRSERERLTAERTALLADVEALTAHLERERERLRIYFRDQLQRIEAGEPGVASSPPMQATDAPVAPGPHDQDAEANCETGTVDEGTPGEVDAGEADTEDTEDTGATGAAGDDDPFLAELRRAVSDDKPLGPREDEPPGDGADQDDDGFDLFAKGDDDPSRFGSRLRRKR
jgi:DivIVA domain-containing protein